MTDQSTGDAIGVTVTCAILLACILPFLLNLRGWRDRQIEQARNGSGTFRRWVRLPERVRVAQVYVIASIWLAISLLGLVSEAAALATGHIV